MCLALTATGVYHAVDVTACPDLYHGRHAVPVPLPGAAPYRCPRPCTRGACRFEHPLPPPPPAPTVWRVSLRLAAAQALLVAAALAQVELVGTAADAQDAPMAHGSMRYYRN